MSNKINFKIKQGSTFQRSLRWETLPYIYKPITSISQSAPVQLVVTGHGLLDGQLFSVQSAKGMTELNTTNFDYKATVIDTNTVAINSVNSLDYKTHTASTGVVAYRTARDLTGYSARMSIRDKVGGSTLYHDLTIANGGIEIDTVSKYITIKIPAATTAAFTWTFGVYDLEAVAPDGTVTTLLQGSISVQKEVTV